MPSSLSDRTALITGASAGIGHATALSLAEAGARVVVNARRGDRLDTLVSDIEKKGGTAHALPADASDPDALNRLWEDATRWAGAAPDILIANAGRGLQGGLLSSDRSQWESMFQLNITGTMHLMRIAAEAMLDREPSNGGVRGDIVVLGSVVGTNVSPFSGTYGSTKFAIEAAAEALRREVGKHGIRVTTVKPGIVESEFQDVAGYDHDTFGKVVEKFGQVLVPQDVAATIRFALEQPPHVNLSQLTVRPVGQDYP